MPFFFATKCTSDVWGDLEERMYPFLSWSFTNACTSFLFSLDSEYTFPFFGVNPFFNSIVWSQVFHTGILFDFFFLNTFLHLQNLLGTSFFNVSLSLSLSTFFTSFLFSSCFFFLHIGKQHVISICYGSPEQKKVFCAFEHLVQNLKAYNGVEI